MTMALQALVAGGGECGGGLAEDGGDGSAGGARVDSDASVMTLLSILLAASQVSPNITCTSASSEM